MHLYYAMISVTLTLVSVTHNLSEVEQNAAALVLQICWVKSDEQYSNITAECDGDAGYKMCNISKLRVFSMHAILKNIQQHLAFKAYEGRTRSRMHWSKNKIHTTACDVTTEKVDNPHLLSQANTLHSTADGDWNRVITDIYTVEIFRAIIIIFVYHQQHFTRKIITPIPFANQVNTLDPWGQF